MTMKRIKWHYQYLDDVEKIVAVLAEKGIEVTEIEAALLWQLYSETLSATWIMVVDSGDEDVVDRGLRAVIHPESEDPVWPVGIVENSQ